MQLMQGAQAPINGIGPPGGQAFKAGMSVHSTSWRRATGQHGCKYRLLCDGSLAAAALAACHMGAAHRARSLTPWVHVLGTKVAGACGPPVSWRTAKQTFKFSGKDAGAVPVQAGFEKR